jgi:hypothetical protein
MRRTIQVGILLVVAFGLTNSAHALAPISASNACLATPFDYEKHVANLIAGSGLPPQRVGTRITCDDPIGSLSLKSARDNSSLRFSHIKPLIDDSEKTGSSVTARESALIWTSTRPSSSAGLSPFTWSISAGALPTDVTPSTMSTSTTLTGPATLPGTANYTIRLSDTASGIATILGLGTTAILIGSDTGSAVVASHLKLLATQPKVRKRAKASRTESGFQIGTDVWEMTESEPDDRNLTIGATVAEVLIPSKDSYIFTQTGTDDEGSFHFIWQGWEITFRITDNDKTAVFECIRTQGALKPYDDLSLLTSMPPFDMIDIDLSSNPPRAGPTQKIVVTDPFGRKKPGLFPSTIESSIECCLPRSKHSFWLNQISSALARTMLVSLSNTEMPRRPTLSQHSSNYSASDIISTAHLSLPPAHLRGRRPFWSACPGVGLGR